MNRIATIHENVLDYFLKVRERIPQFYFVPRKINNKSRLDDGYWFIGNEQYLHISFWDGTDWKEKINNIGFVIHSDKTSKIEFSAQDSSEKAGFLKKVANKLGGFYKDASKDKWYRDLEGKEYLKLLDNFIKRDKPVIDRMLQEDKPFDILPLDLKFEEKYILPVISRREHQIEYGVQHKVTRITWNTEKWQRPSGSQGKSGDQNSYEAYAGFGYEEWLLDKTTIIDGYHYAFLQALNIQSKKHVGNLYDVTLFTGNNLGKKYEVGTLRNIECISESQSSAAYHQYVARGWVTKMENDLLKVNASVEKFRVPLPKRFFNIRFRFREAYIHEELLVISDEDVNITTNHFKLLPKRTANIRMDQVEVDLGDTDGDNWGAGNHKNTAMRSRTFNPECEYDPYHDRMQNFLFELLKAGHEGYNNVKIEKGRVDIKAKNSDGKWHYFEIKTDGPKLSFRKALGQVMEYAYFPSNERAARLIVVGDEEPDAETTAYFQYIRNKFSVPVYYRALKIEAETLSDEF